MPGGDRLSAGRWGACLLVLLLPFGEGGATPGALFLIHTLVLLGALLSRPPSGPAPAPRASSPGAVGRDPGFPGGDASRRLGLSRTLMPPSCAAGTWRWRWLSFFSSEGSAGRRMAGESSAIASWRRHRCRPWWSSVASCPWEPPMPSPAGVFSTRITRRPIWASESFSRRRDCSGTREEGNGFAAPRSARALPPSRSWRPGERSWAWWRGASFWPRWNGRSLSSRVPPGRRPPSRRGRRGLSRDPSAPLHHGGRSLPLREEPDLGRGSAMLLRGSSPRRGARDLPARVGALQLSPGRAGALREEVPGAAQRLPRSSGGDGNRRLRGRDVPAGADPGAAPAPGPGSPRVLLASPAGIRWPWRCRDWWRI